MSAIVPQQPPEDPLIAALPPQTDYLTYLTLLEYRLTPNNLSTLNRLLSADDGTLASEIGWDLLRLVLPMLQSNPKDTIDCLELIAKRGNPREVMVRLAEEFEKLGLNTAEEEDDVDADDAEDNLPTFSGEAERIHLGKMKLDGMPDSDGQLRESSHQDPTTDTADAVARASVDVAVFQALMAMLSSVHVRIKTQYPSRFLATSLPAALLAFRHLPVTRDTSESFLNCIKKLSGSHRPPLPPRTSGGHQEATPANPTPLPDPEALSEGSSGVVVASDNEKNIILRLLQAVTLEVLEETVSALSHQDLPCLLWTMRMRKQKEPTGHLLTMQNQDVDANLATWDPVIRQIIHLKAELGLDALSEIQSLMSADGGDAGQSAQEQDEEEDSVSEYPRTPNEVPLSLAALVLLLAAKRFYDPTTKPLTSDILLKLFMTITPLSDAPVLPAIGVQDALNALAYRWITTTRVPTESLKETDFSILISTLTQSFTTTPDSQLRGDAHHTATLLLRGYPERTSRLAIIKQTIRGACPNPLDPSEEILLAPPIRLSMLKAVGISWLKDQFASYAQEQAISPSAVETGLDPQLLDQDEGFRRLVYAAVPQPPTAIDRTQSGSSLDDFQDELPYYVSVTNLSCVLFSHMKVGTLPLTLNAARESHTVLSNWLSLLNTGSNVEQLENVTDFYALEDACTRLKSILGDKQAVR